jgi:hypothetical protein
MAWHLSTSKSQSRRRSDVVVLRSTILSKFLQQVPLVSFNPLSPGICIHVHVTLPPSPLITVSGHETPCATNESDSDQPHPGTDTTLLPLVPTALNVTPLEPSSLDSNLDFTVPPTPTKIIPLRRKWHIFVRKKPTSLHQAMRVMGQVSSKTSGGRSWRQ